MDSDLRLIEAGFPCHQVGAETQRERDTGKAPPPNRLHVWWARRPLTPSRAAILASLLPADTDPDWFLRQLGIEKPVVELNGIQWVLIGKVLDKVRTTESGRKVLPVDNRVLVLLAKEAERRTKNRAIILDLMEADPSLAKNQVLLRWQEESLAIPEPWPVKDDVLLVQMVAADPAWGKERIAWETAHDLRTSDDKYGYSRAYTNTQTATATSGFTVLDPTSGGGSIPFEALRLGHKVIANELNPVASVILHATLDYPMRFGPSLVNDIEYWGNTLRNSMVERIIDLFPAAATIPDQEFVFLRQHLSACQELADDYTDETLDGFLYCRQVTCPHCGCQAPLLNTCWLSKEAGKQWGVRIISDGREQSGSVQFETYRAEKGQGPNGEDPGFATVNRGVGTCIHCRQAIEADEIKRQARGEFEHGTWKDRLYCVVAVRFQPKLDKHGQPLRYATGPRRGEIKTKKIRFFRPPNETDLKALELSEQRLQENWEHWDEAGLIPTEKFPQGNDMRPAIFGMTRWSDMFTPRQLLGHLILVEELNRLKPQILTEFGKEKGKAIITYLQFAIDKGLDYNSRQTRWEYTRGIIKGTFGRHDFSLKWTFGEMIFSGPNSGAAWGLSQIVDAYKGIAALSYQEGRTPNVTICNGTAAYLESVVDASVDLVCMDPPYYNNVQYAELSDYFYVWQRRTLADLYPDFFRRRLTNKRDEAVANPDRDGGAKPAKEAYERLMGEIFIENRRVVKDDGLLTMMFTHKSQDAWETLTRSLIEHGWTITAAVPVESETKHGIHTKDTASAISSIFITCRKRLSDASEPAVWTGFGGSGVAQRIRTAVAEGLEESAALKLNPVDEMVSSYGRALRVLSEQWPVLDGDEEVGPVKAMSEASRVVAEHQIKRITNGRLQVEDLAPEAAMALTFYGIYGLSELPFDEALNLSRSLNIALENKGGGYEADGRFIGVNTATRGGRRTTARAEDSGFHAPLVRRGSKLRLVRPDERDPRRLEHPQTEWDILQGMLMAHEAGDIPVARAYLEQHAGERKDLIRDLLDVWAAEMADENLHKKAQELFFGL